MSAESPGEKKGFAHWLRPKKSRQRLRKRGVTEPGFLTSASSTSLVSVFKRDSEGYHPDDAPPLPSIAPLQTHRERYREATSCIDTQLGENRDYTAILHALGLQEPFQDADQSKQLERADLRAPGEPVIASLSRTLWRRIARYLNPKDVASLALANKTLYRRLAGCRPFAVLNLPENEGFKIDFLVQLDRALPHHLLCFPCAKYHRRTQEGQEQLQPAQVLNPLFNCPNARNMLRPPQRHRISHSRTLPFTFVQLAMRAHCYGPAYGISTDSLARHWRRDGWSFTTRYHIHNGHLLMRVSSQCFAPPGLTPSAQRLLLFSRDDYAPYFSVCAHWKEGEMTSISKCALSHVPVPRNTVGYQGVEARFKDAITGRRYDPNAVASLCAHCHPMRRCPRCPTEYLLEVKLTEDRSDPKSIHFRHAIIVTRWSDLGDGSSPRSSQEWAACNGDDAQGYDSFAVLGKRAISGIFESAFTHDTVPGRRIISLNPENKRVGEDEDDWY